MPLRRKSHNSQHVTKGQRVRGVGIRNLVFVDTTRETYDYATGELTPDRRLVTEIRYPASIATSRERSGAPVERRGGGYPLVVFAEGYDVRPDLYAPMLDAWVRSGYVVAAPEFPDTTYPSVAPVTAAGDPHGSPENDMVNEPRDLAFVIQRLDALSSSRAGLLHNLVRPNETVLAGQSDGGAVVAAYGYDGRYDRGLPPIRAVAVYEGYEFGGDSSEYAGPTTRAIPLLVAQSTTDTCNAPVLSVQLYDAVHGSKYFLKMMGATHLGPYDGTNPLAFQAALRTTLRFFEGALDPAKVRPLAVLGAGHLSDVSIAFDSPSVSAMPTPAGSPYCAPAY